MASNVTSDRGDPTTSVCMLFTDIEGSTNLVSTYTEAYPQILFRHYSLLQNIIRKHDGEEVRRVGDSVFALFPESRKGVQAAIDAQRALGAEQWPHGGELKVRMGLHKGSIQNYENEVVGIEVHRAARIGAVAHGGQIVISNRVREEVEECSFAPDVTIRDLGLHRLKDLRYPELLFDVVVPGLPSDFGPIASVSANRTNLSLDDRPLCGRESEIASVRRALVTERRRLVTLTGTGGVGKTSLATTIARRLIDDFSRGVFFVEFSDVHSEDLIGSVICQALSIHQPSGVSAVEAIWNNVGDAQLLLLLDTFERVAEGGHILLDLLNACPNLAFLVTSRKTLDVHPERRIEVTPLSVPTAGAGLQQTANNASVQLFVELAQQERPDFELTAANAKSVAAICRRLEGLPLAISLAASHSGLLEPDEILVRLTNHLSTLRNKSRTTTRHRTLRSTIEWSYNILDGHERRTFQALSVFSGGFDLEAAEFVLQGTPDVVDYLRDIESLLSQSLIYKGYALGRPRLAMLDTIREYADEALHQSGSADLYEKRQAEFFTALAVDAAPHVMTHRQREHVEVLFQETGNLRVAIQWHLHQASASGTARLLAALKWFWISRGLFSEALRWTDLAVEQIRASDELPAKAAVLDVAAWVRYLSGDVAGALSVGDESYHLYTRLENRAGIASAGIMSGIAKAISGAPEEGGERIVEALGLFRALGDDYGTVIALLAIGEGARADGDEATAEVHHREAYRLLQDIGNTFWQGHLLQNFAHFRLHSGDWTAARQFASEALSIGEEYDYPMVVNLAIAALSGVALAQGKPEAGARMIGAVDARLSRSGASFEPTDGADFDKIKSDAEECLGGERYAKLTAEGGSASWDSMLALAREL